MPAISLRGDLQKSFEQLSKTADLVSKNFSTISKMELGILQSSQRMESSFGGATSRGSQERQVSDFQQEKIQEKSALQMEKALRAFAADIIKKDDVSKEIVSGLEDVVLAAATSAGRGGSIGTESFGKEIVDQLLKMKDIIPEKELNDINNTLNEIQSQANLQTALLRSQLRSMDQSRAAAEGKAMEQKFSEDFLNTLRYQTGMGQREGVDSITSLKDSADAVLKLQQELSKRGIELPKQVVDNAKQNRLIGNQADILLGQEIISTDNDGKGVDFPDGVNTFEELFNTKNMFDGLNLDQKPDVGFAEALRFENFSQKSGESREDFEKRISQTSVGKNFLKAEEEFLRKIEEWSLDNRGRGLNDIEKIIQVKIFEDAALRKRQGVIDSRDGGSTAIRNEELLRTVEESRPEEITTKPDGTKTSAVRESVVDEKGNFKEGTSVKLAMETGRGPGDKLNLAGLGGKIDKSNNILKNIETSLSKIAGSYQLRKDIASEAEGSKILQQNLDAAGANVISSEDTTLDELRKNALNFVKDGRSIVASPVEEITDEKIATGITSRIGAGGGVDENSTKGDKQISEAMTTLVKLFRSQQQGVFKAIEQNKKIPSWEEALSRTFKDSPKMISAAQEALIELKKGYQKREKEDKVSGLPNASLMTQATKEEATDFVLGGSTKLDDIKGLTEEQKTSLVEIKESRVETPIDNFGMKETFERLLLPALLEPAAREAAPGYNLTAATMANREKSFQKYLSTLKEGIEPKKESVSSLAKDFGLEEDIKGIIDNMPEVSGREGDLSSKNVSPQTVTESNQNSRIALAQLGNAQAPLMALEGYLKNISDSSNLSADQESEVKKYFQGDSQFENAEELTERLGLGDNGKAFQQAIVGLESSIETVRDGLIKLSDGDSGNDAEARTILSNELKGLLQGANTHAVQEEVGNMSGDLTAEQKTVNAVVNLSSSLDDFAQESKDKLIEAADALTESAVHLSEVKKDDAAGQNLVELLGKEGDFGGVMQALIKMSENDSESETALQKAAKDLLKASPELLSAVKQMSTFLSRVETNENTNAAGFIPNYAPNIGVNINAVNEAYKREVTALNKTGIPMSAAKGLVSMDTHPSLKTERNPTGIGLYSMAFGESSLSDAMQQTAARGFNPVKYAGGVTNNTSVPNFARTISDADPYNYILRESPSEVQSKYSLRHQGMIYEFQNALDKEAWIRNTMDTTSGPSYRRPPIQPIRTDDPRYYNSAARPGEPGYRKSNSPEELLPLDRETSITVGYKGRKLDNRRVDETKVNYDDIVSGRFSSIRNEDGSFRTRVITKDKNDKEQVRSFREITNDEAQRNSSLFGLPITNRRMEHLHNEHPDIYQKLITTSKEYHSSKNDMRKKGLAGKKITNEEFKKRRETEARFNSIRKEARAKLNEDFDLKTHRRPKDNEIAVKPRENPRVTKMKRLHEDNPRKEGETMYAYADRLKDILDGKIPSGGQTVDQDFSLLLPKPLPTPIDLPESLPSTIDVQPRELSPRELKIKEAREKELMLTPDGKGWVPFSIFKYVKNPDSGKWEVSNERREEYGTEKDIYNPSHKGKGFTPEEIKATSDFNNLFNRPPVFASGFLPLTSPDEPKAPNWAQRLSAEIIEHEEAHFREAGEFAIGEPQYASSIVSGMQLVDVAPIKGDPVATVSKMDTIISAALAPAQPSDKDKEVAALALGRKQDAINEIKDVQKQKELQSQTEEQKTTGKISEEKIKEVSEKEKDTKEANLSISAPASLDAFVPNYAPDQFRRIDSSNVNSKTLISQLANQKDGRIIQSKKENKPQDFIPNYIPEGVEINYKKELNGWRHSATAVADGKQVGSFSLDKISKEENIFKPNVIVDPAYQGQGLASALNEKVVENIPEGSKISSVSLVPQKPWYKDTGGAELEFNEAARKKFMDAPAIPDVVGSVFPQLAYREGRYKGGTRIEGSMRLANEIIDFSQIPKDVPLLQGIADIASQKGVTLENVKDAAMGKPQAGDLEVKSITYEPLGAGEKRRDSLVTKTQENLKRRLSADEHKLVANSIDEFNSHAASGGFKSEGSVSLASADSGKVFVTPDAKEFPDLKYLSDQNVQNYLVSKEFKSLPDEVKGKVKKLSRGAFGVDLLKLEQVRGGFEARAIETNEAARDPILGQGRGNAGLEGFGEQRAIDAGDFEDRRIEKTKAQMLEGQTLSSLQDKFTEREIKRITEASSERAKKLFTKVAEQRVKEDKLRGLDLTSEEIQKNIEKSKISAEKIKFSRRASGFIPNFAPRVEAAQGIPKTQEYQPVDKLLDDYLAAQPGGLRVNEYGGETTLEPLERHFNNDPKLIKEHHLKTTALHPKYTEETIRNSYKHNPEEMERMLALGDTAIERQIADNGGKFDEKYTVEEHLEAKRLENKLEADYIHAAKKSLIMEKAFRGEFDPEKSEHFRHMRVGQGSIQEGDKASAGLETYLREKHGTSHAPRKTGSVTGAFEANPRLMSIAEKWLAANGANFKNEKEAVQGLMAHLDTEGHMRLSPEAISRMRASRKPEVSLIEQKLPIKPDFNKGPGFAPGAVDFEGKPLAPPEMTRKPAQSQNLSSLQDGFTEHELKRIRSADTEQARRLFIRLAENRVRKGQYQETRLNSEDIQKNIERSQKAEAGRKNKFRLKRRASGFIPNFVEREIPQAISSTANSITSKESVVEQASDDRENFTETLVPNYIEDKKDFRRDFIKDLEGYKTDAYVPQDKTGKALDKSGVTIGAGIDFGSKDEKYFEGVSQETINKVKPYFGLKGKKAQGKIKTSPLKLESEELKTLQDHVYDKAEAPIIKRYNKESKVPFENLTQEQQAHVLSPLFQYGSYAMNKDGIKPWWKEVTNQNWKKSGEELNKWSKKYKTRRGKEAKLLESPHYQGTSEQNKRLTEVLNNSPQFKGNYKFEEGGITKDGEKIPFKERQQLLYNNPTLQGFRGKIIEGKAGGFIPNFGIGWNEEEKQKMAENFEKRRAYLESKKNQRPSQEKLERSIIQYENHVGPLYRKWRTTTNNYNAPTWDEMVDQSRDHYNTTGSMSGSLLSRAGFNSQRFSKELSAHLKVKREEEEAQKKITADREKKRESYEEWFKKNDSSASKSLPEAIKNEIDFFSPHLYEDAMKEEPQRSKEWGAKKKAEMMDYFAKKPDGDLLLPYIEKYIQEQQQVRKERKESVDNSLKGGLPDQYKKWADERLKHYLEIHKQNGISNASGVSNIPHNSAKEQMERELGIDLAKVTRYSEKSEFIEPHIIKYINSQLPKNEQGEPTFYSNISNDPFEVTPSVKVHDPFVDQADAEVKIDPLSIPSAPVETITPEVKVEQPTVGDLPGEPVDFSSRAQRQQYNESKYSYGTVGLPGRRLTNTHAEGENSFESIYAPAKSIVSESTSPPKPIDQVKDEKTEELKNSIVRREFNQDIMRGEWPSYENSEQDFQKWKKIQLESEWGEGEEKRQSGKFRLASKKLNKKGELVGLKMELAPGSTLDIPMSDRVTDLLRYGYDGPIEELKTEDKSLYFKKSEDLKKYVQDNIHSYEDYKINKIAAKGHIPNFYPTKNPLQGEEHIPKFHKGGVVPYQNVDSKGEVLAKLLPGEMVIPRDEVKGVSLKAKEMSAYKSLPSNTAQESLSFVPNYYPQEQIIDEWTPVLDEKGEIRGGAFGAVGTMKDGSLVKRVWSDVVDNYKEKWHTMEGAKDVSKISGKDDWSFFFDAPIKNLDAEEVEMEKQWRGGFPEDYEAKKAMVEMEYGHLEKSPLVPENVHAMPPGNPMVARSDIQTLEQMRVILGDKINLVEMASPEKHSYKDALMTGAGAYEDLTKTHTRLVDAKTPKHLLPFFKPGGKQSKLSRQKFIDMHKTNSLNNGWQSVIRIYGDAVDEGLFEDWSGTKGQGQLGDINSGNILPSNKTLTSLTESLGAWYDKTNGDIPQKEISDFYNSFSDSFTDPKNQAYKIVDLEMGNINLDKLNPEKTEKINNLREEWAKVESDPEVMKKVWENGFAWKALNFGESFMPEMKDLTWREIAGAGSRKAWKKQKDGRPEVFKSETGEDFVKAFDPKEGEFKTLATPEDFLYNDQFDNIEKMRGSVEEKIVQSQIEKYRLQNSLEDLVKGLGVQGRMIAKRQMENIWKEPGTIKEKTELARERIKEVIARTQLVNDANISPEEMSRNINSAKINESSKFRLKRRASGFIPNFADLIKAKKMVPNYAKTGKSYDIDSAMNYTINPQDLRDTKGALGGHGEESFPRYWAIQDFIAKEQGLKDTDFELAREYVENPKGSDALKSFDQKQLIKLDKIREETEGKREIAAKKVQKAYADQGIKLDIDKLTKSPQSALLEKINKDSNSQFISDERISKELKTSGSMSATNWAIEDAKERFNILKSREVDSHTAKQKEFIKKFKNAEGEFSSKKFIQSSLENSAGKTSSQLYDNQVKREEEQVEMFNNQKEIINKVSSLTPGSSKEEINNILESNMSGNLILEQGLKQGVEVSTSELTGDSLISKENVIAGSIASLMAINIARGGMMWKNRKFSESIRDPKSGKLTPKGEAYAEALKSNAGKEYLRQLPDKDVSRILSSIGSSPEAILQERKTEAGDGGTKNKNWIEALPEAEKIDLASNLENRGIKVPAGVDITTKKGASDFLDVSLKDKPKIIEAERQKIELVQAVEGEKAQSVMEKITSTDRLTSGQPVKTPVPALGAGKWENLKRVMMLAGGGGRKAPIASAGLRGGLEGPVNEVRNAEVVLDTELTFEDWKAKRAEMINTKKQMPPFEELAKVVGLQPEILNTDRAKLDKAGKQLRDKVLTLKKAYMSKPSGMSMDKFFERQEGVIDYIKKYGDNAGKFEKMEWADFQKDFTRKGPIDRIEAGKITQGRFGPNKLPANPDVENIETKGVRAVELETIKSGQLTDVQMEEVEDRLEKIKAEEGKIKPIFRRRASGFIPNFISLPNVKMDSGASSILETQPEFLSATMDAVRAEASFGVEPKVVAAPELASAINPGLAVVTLNDNIEKGTLNGARRAHGGKLDPRRRVSAGVNSFAAKGLIPNFADADGTGRIPSSISAGLRRKEVESHPKVDLSTYEEPKYKGHYSSPLDPGGRSFLGGNLPPVAPTPDAKIYEKSMSEQSARLEELENYKRELAEYHEARKLDLSQYGVFNTRDARDRQLKDESLFEGLDKVPTKVVNRHFDMGRSDRPNTRRDLSDAKQEYGPNTVAVTNPSSRKITTQVTSDTGWDGWNEYFGITNDHTYTETSQSISTKEPAFGNIGVRNNAFLGEYRSGADYSEVENPSGVQQGYDTFRDLQNAYDTIDVQRDPGYATQAFNKEGKVMEGLEEDPWIERPFIYAGEDKKALASGDLTNLVKAMPTFVMDPEFGLPNPVYNSEEGKKARDEIRAKRNKSTPLVKESKSQGLKSGETPFLMAASVVNPLALGRTVGTSALRAAATSRGAASTLATGAKATINKARTSLADASISVGVKTQTAGWKIAENLSKAAKSATSINPLNQGVLNSTSKGLQAGLSKGLDLTKSHYANLPDMVLFGAPSIAKLGYQGVRSLLGKQVAPGLTKDAFWAGAGLGIDTVTLGAVAQGGYAQSGYDLGMMESLDYLINDEDASVALRAGAIEVGADIADYGVDPSLMYRDILGMAGQGIEYGVDQLSNKGTPENSELEKILAVDEKANLPINSEQPGFRASNDWIIKNIYGKEMSRDILAAQDLGEKLKDPFKIVEEAIRGDGSIGGRDFSDLSKYGAEGQGAIKLIESNERIHSGLVFQKALEEKIFKYVGQKEPNSGDKVDLLRKERGDYKYTSESAVSAIDTSLFKGEAPEIKGDNLNFFERAGSLYEEIQESRDEGFKKLDKIQPKFLKSMGFGSADVAKAIQQLAPQGELDVGGVKITDDKLYDIVFETLREKMSEDVSNLREQLQTLNYEDVKYYRSEFEKQKSSNASGFIPNFLKSFSSPILKTSSLSPAAKFAEITASKIAGYSKPVAPGEVRSFTQPSGEKQILNTQESLFKVQNTQTGDVSSDFAIRPGPSVARSQFDRDLASNNLTPVAGGSIPSHIPNFLSDQIAELFQNLGSASKTASEGGMSLAAGDARLIDSAAQLQLKASEQNLQAAQMLDNMGTKETLNKFSIDLSGMDLGDMTEQFKNAISEQIIALVRATIGKEIQSFNPFKNNPPGPLLG